MLLVGLIGITSPLPACLCVTLQQDDVTVILCFPGSVLMQLRVEDGTGNAFRRNADSDNPPEAIRRTSTAYRHVTHQQSGSMRVFLFFFASVIQSLKLVQSPSPTQPLRVTIRLNQSYGRALYS